MLSVSDFQSFFSLVLLFPLHRASNGDFYRKLQLVQWQNTDRKIDRIDFFFIVVRSFFYNMLINFQFMHINTNKQHGPIQRSERTSEYHSIHAANQMVSAFSSEEWETSSRAYHEEATGVNVAPIWWIFFIQVVAVLFSLDNCGINHRSSTMSLDTAHWNNELN